MQDYSPVVRVELTGKAATFYRFCEMLCPKYLSKLKLNSLYVMSSGVDAQELEDAVTAAKKFLGRNPWKKVKQPRGTRPQRAPGKRHVDEYIRQMIRYTELNTGIRLPQRKPYGTVPGTFYEKIADHLGL